MTGLEMGLLGGSIAGGIFASNSASSNNARNIRFQREAAQNAHQWEVNDLRKAGLNPILSAGGAGAKPAGGSSIAVPNPLQDAANTALAAERQDVELDNMKATETKIKAEAHKAVSEVNKNDAITRNQDIIQKHLNYQTSKHRVDHNVNEYMGEALKVLRGMGGLGGISGALKGGAKSLKTLPKRPLGIKKKPNITRGK